MAPLRWGPRDHPGAASERTADQTFAMHAIDQHREEGSTLTAQKRPGPGPNEPERPEPERSPELLQGDKSMLSMCYTSSGTALGGRVMSLSQQQIGAGVLGLPRSEQARVARRLIQRLEEEVETIPAVDVFSEALRRLR